MPKFTEQIKFNGECYNVTIFYWPEEKQLDHYRNGDPGCPGCPGESEVISVKRDGVEYIESFRDNLEEIEELVTMKAKQRSDY